MKNLYFLDGEEKDRILNLHESATKRQYLSEQGFNYNDPLNLQNKQNQVVVQGEGNDPYQYMKWSNKFWYAKKSEGKNPKWIEAKSQKAIDSINTKIYGGSSLADKPSVSPIKKTTVIDPKIISSKSKDKGFILVWAFPEYQPKVDGKSGYAQLLGSLIRFTSGGDEEGTYGKLGHGGCVIVKSNGDATCYEFGRYPGAKKGYGKVLSHPLGRIAKIKNGVLINPKHIAKLAKQSTFPPGPSMSMTVAVVKLPNPEKAIDYASVKQREYTALDFSIGDEDANCGTFTKDVAKSGGIQTGSFCFPTPISAVNSFKDKSDNFFEV